MHQRKGRDSNPRNSCPFTAFRVRPDRPLRHLSFFCGANIRTFFECCSEWCNFFLHTAICLPKFRYLCSILLFIYMSWLILFLASICECSFTFCLGKAGLAEGSKATLWYAAFALFYVLSMLFLARAVKEIPIGTAYPIWTGIGAVGTVLIGIFVFKEPATFWRIFFIFTLIASVIGLKMVH